VRFGCPLFATANPSIGGSVIGYREKRDFVVTLRRCD
jgi:hypothetical protein